MSAVLSDFYQLAIKLLAPISAEDSYKTILQEAERLTGAKWGSIYFATKRGELTRIYSTMPKDEQIQPRKDGYAYRTYKSRKLTIINYQELKKIHPEHTYPQRKYAAMIPLSSGRKSLGVIVLQSNKPFSYSQKRIQILELFGSMATLKIRNNILFAQTKTAVETRDLFISMASHELKTPLTTISAYTQLIQKKMAKGEEVKQEWLRVLNTSTQRMTRLINELLHVNQIKTGNLPYRFELCSLADVATYAITEFKSSHENTTVSFDNYLPNEAESMIRGDFDKLVQVVTNLLNNAFKFSQDGTPINVSIFKKKKKGFLSVTDYGRGIPREHIPELFNEFYKVDQHAREGLGLGLFISKKIIEAHRGSITVKSQINKGSTFTFSIPLSTN